MLGYVIIITDIYIYIYIYIYIQQASAIHRTVGIYIQYIMMSLTIYIYIYIVTDCLLHRSHNSIVVFPTVSGINAKDIYHFSLGIGVHVKHDNILRI